jgi:hypothetical protein
MTVDKPVRSENDRQLVPVKRKRTENKDKCGELTEQLSATLAEYEELLYSSDEAILSFSVEKFESEAKRLLSNTVKRLKERKETQVEDIKAKAIEAYMKVMAPIMSEPKSCQMVCCGNKEPTNTITKLDCPHMYCDVCYIGLLEPKRNTVEYLIIKCPLCRVVTKKDVPRYSYDPLSDDDFDPDL